MRENQTLAVEDLNVAGLIKNRKLSRAISDAGWSKFKTMLAAKCDKYGRDLIIVDRWYPSSFACEFRPDSSQLLTLAIDLAIKSQPQNKLRSYKSLIAISSHSRVNH